MAVRYSCAGVVFMPCRPPQWVMPLATESVDCGFDPWGCKGPRGSSKGGLGNSKGPLGGNGESRVELLFT